MNRIYRIRKNGVDTNRTHDSNGNLTNDGTYTYNYNYKNELIETRNVVGGALVQGNNYNCFGIRIFKDLAADVYFYTDGSRVVEERDAADAVAATYVFGDWIDEVLTATRGANTYYASQQALFSVVLWTDANHAEVESIRYTAFGEPTYWFGGGPPPPATPNKSNIAPFAFTGREWDFDTGSYYYRARHMDPLHGRFTTRDPIEFDQLLNQHSYVVNRPTGAQDPFGLCLVLVEDVWINPLGIGARPAPAPRPFWADWFGDSALEIIRICPKEPGQIIRPPFGGTAPAPKPGSAPWVPHDPLPFLPPDHPMRRLIDPSVGPQPGQQPQPRPMAGPRYRPPDKPGRNRPHDGCKECDSPVGTLGYRVDTDHDHAGLGTTHTHHYMVTQTPPPECLCEWKDLKLATPGDSPFFLEGRIGAPPADYTDPPGGGGPNQ